MVAFLIRYANAMRNVGFQVALPRLLLVKRSGGVTTIYRMACTRESLSQGCSFVLETDNRIYVWCGEETSAFERSAANVMLNRIRISFSHQSQQSGRYDACRLMNPVCHKPA